MKLLLTIIFLFGLKLFAQNKTVVDSLVKDLTIQKTDTGRLKTLSELAFLYATNMPTQSLEYANQQKQLADKVNIPKFTANALNDIAIANFYLGKFNTALEFNKASLAIRERLGSKSLMVSSLNKIAIIYQEIGNYDTAAVYQFKILKLAEELNDSSFIGKTYNNLSLVFNNLKNYKQADLYAKLAISVGLKFNDKSAIAGGYGNLASNFDNQNIFDSARFYYEKSLLILTEEDDLGGQATIFNNLGVIFRKEKNNVDGLAAYKKAYDIASRMENENDRTLYGANIGQVLIELKRYNEAYNYLSDAIKISSPLHNWETLKTAYNGMSIYYFLQKNTDSGFYYKNLSDAVTDSSFNLNSSKQISGIQSKYDFEKKENAITLLHKENTIQKLTITKNRVYLWVALGLLLASILITYLLLNRNKIKQETKLQAAVIQQQDLATKGIIDAEERERKRIAGDLHDGVGQLFSTVKMNMEILIEKFLTKEPTADLLAQKTMALVDESCGEVRSIAHQIMPNALMKAGLVSAVRDFINKIPTDKLKIAIQTEGINQKLDDSTETVLYRVIQESVNNVIKHADATQLDITLLSDATEITLTIEDNGKGFDSTNPQKMEGIGLKNIASRIALLKGSFDISSAAGKGTMIAIHIPLV